MPSYPSGTSVSRPSASPRASSADFIRAKTERRKLSMVTCYDYTFARILSQTTVDGILVGR